MGQPREQELIYPHENMRMLRRHMLATSRYTIPYIYPQLISFEIQMGASLLRRRDSRTLDEKADLHYLFNGRFGEEVLQDKSSFNTLVQKLGYQAPENVLVSGESGTDSLLSDVEGLDRDNQSRFCKPLGASQGRGIYIAPSSQEALKFAQEQQVPYLIENFLPPKEDWRYILHRDTQQLKANENQQWRIAYKKVRPVVTGDGHTPIRKLVTDDKEIPLSAKRKYLRKHKQDPALDEVPNDQEERPLISSGNISQGAYGQLPKPNEVEYMDKFMLQFQADIEKEIGGTLGTFCVDIGVKDRHVFDNPYDFDEMRKAIVFYEFQVPFGFSGYLRNLPDQRRGVTSILPTPIYRRLQRANIGLSVIGSSLLSGTLVQRRK